MTLIEKFIEDTNRASSKEDVFLFFQSALQELGYDRICYSLITDHPSMDLKAGHGVMRNYPEDWMKHYMERNYDKTDPVPKSCFVTNKPFTWKWVTGFDNLSLIQKKVMCEAEEANLLDGVAVPMHGVNGEVAGVGLASSTGGVKPDKVLLSKIRSLAFQFHLAYTEYESDSRILSGTEIHLTEREREILLWAAEGKSDSDIADIVGISYPTVRFHLNNVYKKLDANERIYAVTKAIRKGLILPSYIEGGI